jgi:hypothetical protein
LPVLAYARYDAAAAYQRGYDPRASRSVAAIGAILEIIEQRTWHMTLMGRFRNYPPHDAAGCLAFAKALHTPKLYNLIKDAERVADITAR